MKTGAKARFGNTTRPTTALAFAAVTHAALLGALVGEQPRRHEPLLPDDPAVALFDLATAEERLPFYAAADSTARATASLEKAGKPFASVQRLVVPSATVATAAALPDAIRTGSAGVTFGTFRSPIVSAVPLAGLGAGLHFFVEQADAGESRAETRAVWSSAPEAPSASESKVAVERSLSAAARARDVELGLGPEGPVLKALEEAATSGLAPMRGVATLLAVVNADGAVVDVRLLSSSGDAGAWSDARRRAVAALRKEKLSLRGAKGAELTIRLESDIRLPSGASVPVTPVFEGSQVRVTENAPTGGLPTVVKTVTIARFDVADINARPRRVVHARLLSLKAL